VVLTLSLENKTMKGLSLEAGLNDTAVRDIIKGRVKSPSLNTIQKIANIMKCELIDLINRPINNFDNYYRRPPLNKLSAYILNKAISKADLYITTNNITLTSEQRATLYIKFYEFIHVKNINNNKILNQEENHSLDFIKEKAS
jgi:hypothetical protein